MISLYLLAHLISAMASPSTEPSISSPTMDNSSDHVPHAPQLAILDMFFPGFSVFASAIHKYLHIDLNLYIPLVLLIGVLTVVWNYSSQYLWEQLESYFMSSVDIRTDDEIYNILMTWVANQRFSQGARRFVVNTNLNSRSWYLWRWDNDEEEDTDFTGQSSAERKKKALSYTPSFGTHYFWYRGRLLLFRRNAKDSHHYSPVSEREEISVCCFGRNPYILKELLLEARALYIEKDQSKTLIYRGALRAGSTEPNWQRCMARSTRPFSTVILNEKTKTDLIEDVTDYLQPATQRWYSNRGIPYRRGYLLHGPPGTGKSSLSLALAGFFKMRIYIVSLSSMIASEENLATLFAELPRRCVVLLEDIDTAGLTHTREDNNNGANNSNNTGGDDMEPSQTSPGNGNTNSNNNNNNKNQPSGRLSLSGLLNILDGVASQEGRVLIMTTNHLEKLDKALIRPGRVDMIVEFGRADADMTAAIFRAIFAQLEGEDSAATAEDDKSPLVAPADALLDEAVLAARAEEKRARREAQEERTRVLALEFAAKIPAHEFSPAEIQGHLMRYKRDAQAAIAKAEEFVEQTRKDRKEKELKEAEEKRKEAEKKKEEEEEKKKKKEEEDKKKKEEQEAKEKEKAKKEQRKKKKADRRKKQRKDDSDSDSSSDDTSESEAEGKKAKSTSIAEAVEPLKTGDNDGKKIQHKHKDSGYVTPSSVEA